MWCPPEVRGKYALKYPLLMFLGSGWRSMGGDHRRGWKEGVENFALFLLIDEPGSHPGQPGSNGWSFQGIQDCFLHSCTQIILARGDLICKDEADDVLMFLSSALKYRIDFSKWNPPWKPVSPKNGKPAPLVPKTGFLTCHGTWRGERVLK